MLESPGCVQDTHHQQAGGQPSLTSTHPLKLGLGPTLPASGARWTEGASQGPSLYQDHTLLVMGWECGGASPGLWLFCGFSQRSESTVLFLPPLSFPLSCWNFLGMAQCSLGKEEGGVGFCPAGILEMSLPSRPPLCWPLCSRFQQLHGVCLSGRSLPHRGPTQPTCFVASVLLMMLMAFCMTFLVFFLSAAEDRNGSQVFQQCLTASITRALLLAMPPNLKGNPDLERRRHGCTMQQQHARLLDSQGRGWSGCPEVPQDVCAPSLRWPRGLW